MEKTRNLTKSENNAKIKRENEPDGRTSPSPHPCNPTDVRRSYGKHQSKNKEPMKKNEKNGMHETELKNQATDEQTKNITPLSSADCNELEVSAERDGAFTSPLCRKDCKTCNSDHLQEIHELLETDMKYVDICVYLKDEYNFSISPSSITRHIQNFRRNRRETINRKFLKEVEQITDGLAKDKAKAAFLGTLVFKNILKRIEMGTIEFDISDYEKIQKLEHGILNGNSGSIDDLLGIFRVASNKYNVPLEQESLGL